MMFHHPITAVRHVIETKREKKLGVTVEKVYDISQNGKECRKEQL